MKLMGDETNEGGFLQMQVRGRSVKESKSQSNDSARMTLARSSDHSAAKIACFYEIEINMFQRKWRT